MSFTTQPPPAGFNGQGTIIGGQFLSPSNTWIDAATIALAAGAYQVSGTVQVAGGAAQSTIQVRILSDLSTSPLILVQADVPSGLNTVIAVTPRRIVLAAPTVLRIQAQNTSITTAQLFFLMLAGTPGSYLFAEPCS